MAIYYTGIGADRGFMHTDARLLSTEIFNIEDGEIFNGFILPEDLPFFTLEDWVEFSGAESV